MSENEKNLENENENQSSGQGQASTTLYVRLNLLKTWPLVRTEVFLCFILCCLCMCCWDMPSTCRKIHKSLESEKRHSLNERNKRLISLRSYLLYDCSICQSIRPPPPLFLMAVLAIWRQNQTEDKDKGSKHKSISKLSTLGQRGLRRPYNEAKCKIVCCFFRLYVCHDNDSSDEVVMLMIRVKNGGVIWR